MSYDKNFFLNLNESEFENEEEKTVFERTVDNVKSISMHSNALDELRRQVEKIDNLNK